MINVLSGRILGRVGGRAISEGCGQKKSVSLSVVQSVRLSAVKYPLPPERDKRNAAGETPGL